MLVFLGIFTVRGIRYGSNLHLKHSGPRTLVSDLEELGTSGLPTAVRHIACPGIGPHLHLQASRLGTWRILGQRQVKISHPGVAHGEEGQGRKPRSREKRGLVETT